MPANLVDLFSEHGFSPVKKTATEWSSPCPFCGGKDRCQIWPDENGGAAITGVASVMQKVIVFSFCVISQT